MSHWRWSLKGPSHPMSLGVPMLQWSRHETHSRKTQSFDYGPQSLDRANCGPVRLNWWRSWMWLDIERH